MTEAYICDVVRTPIARYDGVRDDDLAAVPLIALREREVDWELVDDVILGCADHPPAMSGARLALTAIEELHRRGGRYALCTMCIGVSQGIAPALEKV